MIFSVAFFSQNDKTRFVDFFISSKSLYCKHYDPTYNILLLVIKQTIFVYSHKVDHVLRPKCVEYDDFWFLFFMV